MVEPSEATAPAPARSTGSITVELTEGGSVWIDADDADELFPGDALVAVAKADELWLVPLVGTHAGGLLLKRRNLRGDRSALVSEALRQCADEQPVGARRAVWDAAHGALRVPVGP